MTRVQLTGMNGVTSPSIRPSAMPPRSAPIGLPEPAQHGDDEALELIGVARQQGEGEECAAIG